MGMGLTKEVLSPRQVPCERRNLRSEVRTRAAITRAIWTSVALAGLANVAAHMLGTWL